MTLPLMEKDFALEVAIGRRLGVELAATPLKAIQRDAGRISKPTASNFRRGELPQTFKPFFSLLRHLGRERAARVLEPVIGRVDSQSLAERLATRPIKDGDPRHDRTRLRAALDVPRHSGFLGTAGAPRDAERGCEAGDGGSAMARLAVTSLRRRFADLSGEERAPFGRHLSGWAGRGGRVEVADAVAFALADPLQRTGVAVKSPGGIWMLQHVAAANPMHADPAGLRGRPVATAHCPVYGPRVAAEFDAAEADGAPWVVDLGVSLVVGGAVRVVAGRVLRTVERTRTGISVLTASFSLSGDVISEGAFA